MSYDLHLLRISADASEEEIEDAARALVEADLPVGPPDPDTEARKRALADALLAAFPELKESHFDYSEIARFQGITESEARQRNRWIELHGPEDGAPVEIDLYDAWVNISMPYGERSSTERDMAELWRYLEVLVREGGFVVWDPQGPNVVDVAGGPDGERGAEQPQKEPRRSRWRFW